MRERAAARSRVFPSGRERGSRPGGGRPVSRGLRRCRDRPRRAVGGRGGDRGRQPGPARPARLGAGPAGRTRDCGSPGRPARGARRRHPGLAPGGRNRAGRAGAALRPDPGGRGRGCGRGRPFRGQPRGPGDRRPRRVALGPGDRPPDPVAPGRPDPGAPARALRAVGRAQERPVRPRARPPGRDRHRGVPGRAVLPFRYAGDRRRAHRDPAGAGPGRAGPRRRARQHGRRRPGHHHPGRGPGRDPVAGSAPAGGDRPAPAP